MSEQDQVSVKTDEVKQLVDLLQYQDGSIVSRVLLKNKGGTVTLFAFDEGEGLSEHTAPFDALVVVIDGDADIEIAGESFKVRQGRDHHPARESASCSEGGYQVQNAAHHDPRVACGLFLALPLSRRLW